MSPSDKVKIGFGDLDTFLKIAPVIGISVLAYLQTMFPSKVEFEKLEQHLIQMDKKITEISAQKKLEYFRRINPSYKFPSFNTISGTCLLYTSPSPRDRTRSRMPSSA